MGFSIFEITNFFVQTGTKRQRDKEKKGSIKTVTHITSIEIGAMNLPVSVKHFAS